MKTKLFTRIAMVVVAAGLLVSACGAAPGTSPSATAGSVPTLAATVSSVPAATVTRASTTATTPESLPVTGDEATATPAATSAPQQTAAHASLALDCSAPAELTPAQTEGPYFKANSPERASLLEEGMPGTRLVLEGYVLAADCTPLANATVDFWQADANGAYDNEGFILRGHQFTDANGYYRLETVVPGEYPGRTPHIHVKVIPSNGPELTTQVYFPGSAGNTSDRIFNPASLVKVESEGQDSILAAFNFVVNTR